jgi:hypothetical protein
LARSSVLRPQELGDRLRAPAPRAGLPLPTGGATHLLELVVILLALELVSGRREIWLPRRWARLWLGGPARRRFLHLLLVLIRRLERVSPPRLRFRFDHWLSNVLFGSLVAAGSIGALLAPPFSALDTLAALGAVLVSLGVLLEDVAVVAVGSLAGAAGVALEVVLAARARLPAVSRRPATAATDEPGQRGEALNDA